MRREHDETSCKMLAYRKERGIKFEEMARRCGTTGVLLSHIERGDWITHPKIAARICKEYELDVDDYNAIVHEDYRTDKLPKAKPKPGGTGYSTPKPAARPTYDDIL